ncbi:MAG TPA: hypothetical protein VJV96_15970 [Candidatus Angelobacter sp.]|nr:hypothetical protein [Candidatus Angelobacter sp.]
MCRKGKYTSAHTAITLDKERRLSPVEQIHEQAVVLDLPMPNSLANIGMRANKW